MKLVSLVILISLVTSVFFVFGVHEIQNHFCPLNATSGICGLLGGVTQVMDHIFSMNVFLALVLPIAAVFFALTGYKILESLSLSISPEYRYAITPTAKPKVEFKESRWLSFHINSPTL